MTSLENTGNLQEKTRFNPPQCLCGSSDKCCRAQTESVSTCVSFRLYKSSKSTPCTDDSLTSLQWCRQALDSPKSEVEAARQSLSLRLDQGRRRQARQGTGIGPWGREMYSKEVDNAEMHSVDGVLYISCVLTSSAGKQV